MNAQICMLRCNLFFIFWKKMYVVTCKHQMHTKSDCENTDGSYNFDRRNTRWKIATIGMSICSLNLENE